MTKFLINNKTEAALLLVSTKNCDLWVGPTPEVCDSRTCCQIWHIWREYKTICFLVLTKTSSDSRDENVSKKVIPAERVYRPFMANHVTYLEICLETGILVIFVVIMASATLDIILGHRVQLKTYHSIRPKLGSWWSVFAQHRWRIYSSKLTESLFFFLYTEWLAPPPGDITYNGLYREAPPERGTFFRLQVYKRIGISQVEDIKGRGNRSFRHVKGPYIKIFRIVAPYGCI